jgi:hypothetical protein
LAIPFVKSTVVLVAVNFSADAFSERIAGCNDATCTSGAILPPVKLKTTNEAANVAATAVAIANVVAPDKA